MNEHLNPADPNPANVVTPLTGTIWVLSEMRAGDSGRAVPLGVRSTLTLADGQVSLEAGCNRGHADAKLGVDSIEFGPMALTRMMCDDDAMNVEREVCAVLQGTVDYSREGHVLVLGTAARCLVYRSDLAR